MSIEISTQLFLGAEEKIRFSSADMKEKISRTNDSLDLKKLMIWDTDPSDLTGEIISFCRSLNIETYLWHPVLADMNQIDVSFEAMAPVPGINSLAELSGRWSKIGSGEENFLFIDPAGSSLNDVNFSGFQALADIYDFDGVFLDRIRYPSPVNGFETIFSTYSTSYGDDVENRGGQADRKMEKLRDFYRDIKDWDDRKLDSFSSFEEIFRPFGDFFQFKRDRITEKVGFYYDWAAGRGKKLGLDLLASGLSFFTGQDYGALSERCDWIKDMTYCYGMGPAALPLEIICLTEGFRKLAPGISEEAFLQFLKRHWGLVLPGKGLGEIGAKGVSPVNALIELEAARGQTENRVPVLSGLEMVNSPYFSTGISESMVEAYLDALKGRTSGIVASWNILHIPDGHFKLLGRGIE